jgi:hypothetical protein
MTLDLVLYPTHRYPRHFPDRAEESRSAPCLVPGQDHAAGKRPRLHRWPLRGYEPHGPLGLSGLNCV